MKRVEVLPATDMSAQPRIAPWKFTAGVLIHLSVPAYLLTLLVTFILHVLEQGTAEGALSLMPGVSLWFVALYTAATIAGTGIAALAGSIGRARHDRRLTRLGERPAIQSQQALSHAVGMLGAIADDPMVASILNRIAEAAWQHDDERYQQVSRDLDKAAATYSGAHAAAHGEQQLQVSRLAAETLGHFAQRLDELTQESATAATQRAQTMAGYIASKYGDDLDSVR